MIYLFSSKPKTLVAFFEKENIPFTLVTKELFERFQGEYSPLPEDMGIVYDFGSFVKQKLLDSLFMVNIHFSLLPKYRGAVPVEAAILNGENETGISIQKMVSQMDAGDIIVSKKVAIEPHWNSKELQSHMDSLLPQMLHDLFLTDREKWTANSQIGEPSFCYMKLLNRENAQLFPAQITAQDLVDRVRAFNPEPYAWLPVTVKGKETTCNISEARVLEEFELQPNEVQFLKKRGLAIGTKKGTVLVTALVIAGSKVLKDGDIVALKGSLCVHV